MLAHLLAVTPVQLTNPPTAAGLTTADLIGLVAIVVLLSAIGIDAVWREIRLG